MAKGNRLTDMEFDEISLVTRPANQLSKVVLFKSDTTKEDEDMSEETAKSDVTKDDNEQIELPQEVFDYITALEEANADLLQQVEKMAAAADPEDDSEGDETELLKSADPRIVELIKSAEQRAEAAERIAKAERDVRLEREFVSKAQGLNQLPVNADEFGKVLKSVAEAVDADTFAKVWQVLEAANNSIKSGGLFNEIGKSNGTNDTGPISNIDREAARIREQFPNLSREQAIAKAVESDPSLYTEYLREVK